MTLENNTIKQAVTTLSHTKDVPKKIGKLLGKRISDARMSCKYSQKDVVKMAKVSMTVLYDIENGRKIPRVETIVKLAIVLNIPITDIFSPIILPEKFCDGNYYPMEPKEDTSNEASYITIIRRLLTEEDLNKADIDNILDYIEYRKERTKKLRSQKSIIRDTTT